jgi:hypothetical protein
MCLYKALINSDPMPLYEIKVAIFSYAIRTDLTVKRQLIVYVRHLQAAFCCPDSSSIKIVHVGNNSEMSALIL